MRSRPEILERLQEDLPIWGLGPIRLLEAIESLGAESADYLTLPLLARKVRLGPATEQKLIEVLYKYAEYLASERIGALDRKFELVREDDSAVILEPKAVAEAIDTGVLHDPDSGESIPDWRSHIVIFYSARRYLRSEGGR